MQGKPCIMELDGPATSPSHLGAVHRAVFADLVPEHVASLVQDAGVLPAGPYNGL